MEPKTKPTEVCVEESHHCYCEREQRNTTPDAGLALLRRVTKQEPIMWGPSIVGFGSYHYKYASGHEGDSALAGLPCGKWVGCLHRCGFRRS